MPKQPDFNMSEDGHLRCTVYAEMRLTPKEYATARRMAEKYGNGASLKVMLSNYLMDRFYPALYDFEREERMNGTDTGFASMETDEEGILPSEDD